MDFLEIVCTGNELLDGSVVDTNSQFVAEKLRPLGLRISRVTVVPDDPSAIIQAVHEAASRAKHILISGGLGPTSDDLTLESIAASLGRKLVLSRLAKINVMKRLKRLGRREVNAGHHKQMMIPEGATALKNREGTAPGIRLRALNSIFYFLPGVPREFHCVFEDSVLGDLRASQRLSAKASGGETIGEFLFVFKVFGWRESDLNELMKKAPLTSSMTVGYRTHLPENHIKIVVMAKERSRAVREIQPLRRWLKSRLGLALFAEGTETFEESWVKRLAERKLKVTIAESCTGGLVSSMITSVAGSSAVLDRSFITYSNDAKMDLLGVQRETLERYGAVSEETVREMAKGALKNSKAEVALAVSGIAGPGGGTRAKPVGTIWCAVATKRKVVTKLLGLHFHRKLNQRYAAYAVMQMLREIMR